MAVLTLEAKWSDQDAGPRRFRLEVRISMVLLRQLASIVGVAVLLT
jgi:hypothetical protein